MARISESFLIEVRRMVCSGMTVPGIARAVKKRLMDSTASGDYEIAEHPTHALKDVFRLAFFLSISDVGILLPWDLDGEIDDVRLNQLLVPAIILTREQWIDGLESSQWIRDVPLELWDQAIFERPRSIPEHTWEILNDDSRTSLRCLYNSARGSAFACACLAAQVQQLSMRLERGENS